MDNKTLTINYLINLLNNHTELKIERHKYLIDSYPILKINNTSYYNLVITLLIACKNIKYTIDNTTLKISLSNNIIDGYFKNIEEFIKNFSIDITKKKKYINYLLTQNRQEISTYPINESILILTQYFGINLIIYNSESQIIKLYYYDNLININLPFIIIKETKEINTTNVYYELVFSQNKYTFDNTHPLIIELIKNSIVIGFEQNKKLEYLELNNISNDLIEIKPKIITLIDMPKKYLKLIKEFKQNNIHLF